MQIGMVGLGRMGANMTLRLTQHGHEVVAFDVNPEAVAGVASEGAKGVADLDELVQALEPPRAVWLMLPAGPITEDTVQHLETILSSGDTIVEGGNSHYQHAVADAERLSKKGIAFVDAGVSGGVWGLKEGYCLMVGGDASACERLEPIFLALAPENGYAHVGPVGAGHYAKMIHNGIEYGMLQAYAEGFALLHAAEEFDFDLRELAELWRHGSVVRSWLLDLTVLALENEVEFAKIKGYVEDSGEGRWTVDEAVKRAVPAPVLTMALYERFSSRRTDNFAARIIAALRNEFGGHKLFEESAGAEAAREQAGPAEESAGPEAAATQ
jgi:6-phosphogluconate dehydrogenase